MQSTHVATRITECLADISAWIAAHHLKLNLSKTDLLFILGNDCPRMDLSVTVKDVTVSPSLSARNLGVILGDGLSCAPNITFVARSCRFAPYNIRSIWPFLTKDATQLLFRLNRCSISSIFSHVNPSSGTSTGFLLRPTSDLRQCCKPSKPSTELHQFTSKHWSNHTPQNEHFALLHQLASWYRHH